MGAQAPSTLTMGKNNMSNSYNGWTNYATWRVHLEMWDGQSPRDIMGRRPHDFYELADALKEQTQEYMEMSGEGFVLDYALAFLSDVNWQEIAKHVIEAYADEDEDAGVLENAAWYDTSAELE